MGHEGLSVVDMIPLLNQIPSHVAYAIIVIVLLMIILTMATRGIRKEPKRYFNSEGRLTVRTAGEVIAEMVLKIVKQNMGPRGPEFMLIIGTLGLFILVSNVLGMIPGFQSPTANINTTGACAITVFCLTHYYGVRQHGIKYLKQFMGPLIWLAPFMVPLELISHIVRPVSLSIRLFCNIFADHLTVAVFFLLVPWLLPLPFMFLGLLVAIIQTFVFILLSMTFFSMAIEEPEH
jgi:F-type H+-transporting ATPase subunit a